MKSLYFRLFLGLWLGVSRSGQAVEFVRDIQPIFQAHCDKCHGLSKEKGGLSLATRARALKGGDAGVVLLPTKASLSPLIQRVTSAVADKRMPPEGERLSSAEIELLRAWIDEGVPWPERAVRFVQLYHGGGGDGWDTHGANDAKHLRNGKQIDKPIAGLITDLKARGLLDSTLILWGGEFGRTPTSEGSDGRDHSPYGYSVWMAGGGIKGGTVYGATDDFGFTALENPVQVRDLHATILHLLGLQHDKLTFYFQGLQQRLSQVDGESRVIKEILA